LLAGLGRAAAGGAPCCLQAQGRQRFARGADPVCGLACSLANPLAHFLQPIAYVCEQLVQRRCHLLSNLRRTSRPKAVWLHSATPAGLPCLRRCRAGRTSFCFCCCWQRLQPLVCFKLPQEGGEVIHVLRLRYHGCRDRRLLRSCP